MSTDLTPAQRANAAGVGGAGSHTASSNPTNSDAPNSSIPPDPTALDELIKLAAAGLVKNPLVPGGYCPAPGRPGGCQTFQDQCQNALILLVPWAVAFRNVWNRRKFCRV